MTGLDWVQVDSGFSSSLAVMCATDLLDMDARTFTGAMVDLQDWAVRNLPSGRFAPLPASNGHPSDAASDARLWRKMLERVVRWDGAPGAYWDAHIHARNRDWEDGTVRLTLCDRYVQVLEKRAKDAERKRRERAAGRSAPASAGRPMDAAGTSPPRKRKDKENEKKTSSAAAPVNGSAPGLWVPVPTVPTETPAEEPPVQRSLPGIHLVPASPPSEERLLAAAAALGTSAADAPPGAAPTSAGTPTQAVAFFESFQDERCKTFPGVPREARPAGWTDWYRQALSALGEDEGRLLEACRAYLASDWGRARQPAGTALAFCSPKVWVRYVAPLAQREVPSEPTSQEPTTEAGRLWRDCLTRLQEDGHRYAVTWLLQARPVGVADGHLVLEAPNAYVGQWLREHYGPLIERVAQAVSLEGVHWRLPTEDASRRTIGGA